MLAAQPLLPGKERSRLPVSEKPVFEKPVFEKLESAYLNPGIDVVINVLKRCVLNQAVIGLRTNQTLSIPFSRSELSKSARKYPIMLLRVLVI